MMKKILDYSAAIAAYGVALFVWMTLITLQHYGILAALVTIIAYIGTAYLITTLLTQGTITYKEFARCDRYLYSTVLGYGSYIISLDYGINIALHNLILWYGALLVIDMAILSDDDDDDDDFAAG